MIEAGDFQIRTDLALETQERIRQKEKSLHGVQFTEEKKGADMRISTVVIETENAAKQLGRPRGTYVTVEDPRMSEKDADYHREISMEVARCIRQMLPFSENSQDNSSQDNSGQDDVVQGGSDKVSQDLKKEINCSVLIVGLGNRDVTPDALGPSVADNLYITRHIIREFGKYAFGTECTSRISSIVPGVMAQTGMECVEILRGVVQQTKPDVLITVDALAARSMRRLGRTIQLTNTGITPGSGVGNHRNAINKESIGIPVISIGVPTVVDAATIVSDVMSDFIASVSDMEQGSLARMEPQEAAQKLLTPQLYGMFVTPKDIDEIIKQLSYLISESLNIAFLGDKERDF